MCVCVCVCVCVRICVCMYVFLYIYKYVKEQRWFNTKPFKYAGNNTNVYPF